jgi:hypothetical protein
MLRTIRIISALLVVTTMLLSQWAVAAHLCPKVAQTAAAEHVMPCHEMATGTASTDKALCKQHCTDDHRTVVDHTAHPPLQFVAAFVVPLAPLVESTSSINLLPDAGLSHALGPPPALAHCCLRI